MYPQWFLLSLIFLVWQTVDNFVIVVKGQMKQQSHSIMSLPKSGQHSGLVVSNHALQHWSPWFASVVGLYLYVLPVLARVFFHNPNTCWQVYWLFSKFCLVCVYKLAVRMRYHILHVSPKQLGSVEERPVNLPSQSIKKGFQACQTWFLYNHQDLIMTEQIYTYILAKYQEPFMTSHTKVLNI